MKPVTRALPLVLLLAATHVHALGLGQARVASDLSSPLLVEIPLVNLGASGLLPEEVRVDVPGFDEHARLGAPEPILPQGARIRVLTDARGRALVRITTRNASREPVLRFLLRVSWQGRVAIREYELLVDPPVVARPQPRTQTTIVSTPAAPAPLAGARTRSAPLAGSRYGPIVDGDTLYAIATAAYPQLARDVRRVAAVIVERNPGAFINGDRNLLRIGAQLDLPDTATLVAALPPARSRAPVPQPERPSPRAAAVVTGDEYIVRPGDTLYGIARGINGARGADLEVLVDQLYNANPGAFLDRDRDRLRVGAVLSLDGVARAAAPSGRAPSTAPAVASAVTAAASDVAPAQQPQSQAMVSAPEQAAGSSSTVDAEVVVTPEALTALRDELASVDAAVEQERARESELRSRIDSVIEEADALRAREAQLTAETAALREQIALQAAGTGSAEPGEAANAEATVPASIAAAASDPVAAAATTSAAQSPAPVAAAAVVASAATDAPAAATTVADTPSSVSQQGPASLPTRRRELTAMDKVTVWLRRVTGGDAAGSPLLLAGGGAAVLALLLALLMRRRRGATAAGPATAAPGKADEEATQRRLAEVREQHEGLRTGDFTDEGEIVRTAGGRTVVMTDAAKANNLAKEAAVHMAYGDLESSKACILEAVRLDPRRDEHKMMLITVYESTNEHAKARAIVEDLLSRREQLPSDIRAQVESKLQDRAAG